MATSLSYRPSTTATANNVQRQASLSSFPARVAASSTTRDGMPASHVPRVTHRGNSGSSSGTTSSPSSIKNTHQRNGIMRPARKLRSQYPADSDERHVEYILVASFDIDRGSVMEHQYPGAISGDESMLAELMLPDQAHARKEDWTIFFLHKEDGEDEGSGEDGDTDHPVPDGAKQDENQSKNAPDDADTKAHADEDDEGGEGPPLIYVLNLVNTKHDSSVKRLFILLIKATCSRLILG